MLLALLALPLFVSAATCPTLSRNISFGSRGQDVVSLQNFLMAESDLAAGNNSGYFGRLTERAVKSFQRRHNIVSSGTPSSTGYGVVGRKTRAKIASVCGKSSGDLPSAPSSGPYVPAQPTELAHCPLIDLPIGKPCSGTWTEVRDTKGCTASWECKTQ